ncbi:MAG: hypothetical protein ACJ76D_07175, partial [Solirubrobacterales bacterium]
ASIINGQVKNPDLAPDSIGSAKVIYDGLNTNDINEATLSEVPQARTLQGLTANAFQRAGVVHRTNEGARLGGSEVRLTHETGVPEPKHLVLESGPFSVYAKCLWNGEENRLVLEAYSTEAGSVADVDNGKLNSFIPQYGVDLYQAFDNHGQPFSSRNFSLAAPSGARLDGVFNVGMNILSADCVAGVGAIS